MQALIIYPFVAHYRKEVLRQLASSRVFEIRLFSGSRSPRDSIKVIDKFELSYRPLLSLWAGPFLLQPAAIRIALTTNARVVVMVGDWKFLSTWLAALIFRARKIPVLFWTIGWHRADSNPLKKSIRLRFYKIANALMVYGTHAEQIGIESGYPAERIYVIGNSFDIDHSLGAVRPLPHGRETDLLPDCREVVGAVIRPNPVKRLDLLIEAVAHLRSNGRNVGIIIAGDSASASGLRKRAADSEVPLLLTGAVYSQESLERLYARIAVTVVPEAVGLTAIQSLWYGTPVVTCDDPDSQMPEFASVIPGVTGAHYLRGNVPDLAHAIEEWLDAVADSPERVAAACRQEAEANWSAKAHAKRIEDVMRTLAHSADMR